MTKPVLKTKITPMNQSKRLILTYVVLFLWLGLAIFGIIIDTNLYALATYFASGLPLILGYLWSETSRPSLKGAARIVKNIGHNNNSNYVDDYSHQPEYVNYESEEPISLIKIYSSDTSIQLEITSDNLIILQNVGYIENVDGKYIFDKNILKQIKSLINENINEPEI